jgi:hypothetical protein
MTEEIAGELTDKECETFRLLRKRGFAVIRGDYLDSGRASRSRSGGRRRLVNRTRLQRD